MAFYETLSEQTKEEQESFFQIPLIHRALGGEAQLGSYIAFLTQAYHHVKHTTPLLMAVGSELPARHAWLRPAVAHYIAEEIGHEEWILDDLAACGTNVEAVRNGEPGRACELMVAYAYDVVRRRSPIGFFGMVFVLEGASVRGAGAAAQILPQRLGLPETAFRYLSSHGALDVEHVEFLRGLMDRVTDPEDQGWILHCARRFFGLYGDIFRGLPAGGSA